MQKLDESKPCGTAFRGPDSYYEQDGKLFHMNSKEFFCSASTPIPAPVPALIPAPHPVLPEPVRQPKFACKFCGAERDTPDIMKEHLLACHRDEVPELLVSADPANGKDETAVAEIDSHTGEVTNVKVLDKALTPTEVADLAKEHEKPKQKKPGRPKKK